ncbi:MAG: DUF1549 domain-containing protein, partial [Planctomycetaceae bacterium]
MPLSGIRLTWLVAFVSATAAGAADSRTAPPTRFVVRPARVELRGDFARGQLIVTAADHRGTSSDRSRDLTHDAVYGSSNPGVVTVGKTGRLLAAGNGTTNVSVIVNGLTRTVPVTVSGVNANPQVGFASHVMPVLSKAGCNMGACHASQYGKGGFKLSVFGYQPRQDHAHIVRDRRQRRLNKLQPERSLILRKPTMQVPHGGGKRLHAGSVDYRILTEWIRNGAPPAKRNAPHVTKLVVTPPRRVGETGLKQQLRVDALYSDGTTRDVTAWAKYDSMDEALLDVDAGGRVTALGNGQAPVMVRFEGQAQIAMFVMPYAKAVRLTGWKSNNFVDELAAGKFRELGIEPSPLCDDATFIRRAFFDAVGALPTVQETTAFLSSRDPRKREKLVDRLLGLTGNPKLDAYNDRYAAFWTLKWSDLIRNSSNNVGEQGMWSLHNWLKESFRTNKRFDKFVTELVTAKGSTYSNGPANYFRINRNASDLTESTTQLFLGIRMQCAKCHHHPFEVWSQDDFYGFASFFSRVGHHGGLSPPISGGEELIFTARTGELIHGRTGEVVVPKTLTGAPLALRPADDPREVLAD